MFYNSQSISAFKEPTRLLVLHECRFTTLARWAISWNHTRIKEQDKNKLFALLPTCRTKIAANVCNWVDIDKFALELGEFDRRSGHNLIEIKRLMVGKVVNNYTKLMER